MTRFLHRPPEFQLLIWICFRNTITFFFILYIIIVQYVFKWLMWLTYKVILSKLNIPTRLRRWRPLNAFFPLLKQNYFLYEISGFLLEAARSTLFLSTAQLVVAEELRSQNYLSLTLYGYVQENQRHHSHFQKKILFSFCHFSLI